MQSEVNDISERSLQKAKEHDRNGNFGKAYAYYTIVAELCPAKRSEIEETFTDILCKTLIVYYILYVIYCFYRNFFIFRYMGDRAGRE